eukprot:COSAG03_NODE_24758_length_270_cov_0.602339_1_plen_23_part_10
MVGMSPLLCLWFALLGAADGWQA